jgi:hypothetical protein
MRSQPSKKGSLATASVKTANCGIVESCEVE